MTLLPLFLTQPHSQTYRNMWIWEQVERQVGFWASLDRVISLLPPPPGIDATPLDFMVFLWCHLWVQLPDVPGVYGTEPWGKVGTRSAPSITILTFPSWTDLPVVWGVDLALLTYGILFCWAESPSSLSAILLFKPKQTAFLDLSGAFGVCWPELFLIRHRCSKSLLSVFPVHSKTESARKWIMLFRIQLDRSPKPMILSRT